MDIHQVAKYFDTVPFDAYDFTTGSWALKAFMGQLKKADTFVEIWNRPTRKRAITTAIDQMPTSPVVRANGLPEVFMVGTGHRDVWNGAYRYTASLHLTEGPVRIRRTAPSGPTSDPGWAADNLFLTTFGDSELRTSPENENKQIIQHGSFFVFLPHNTPIQEGDLIELDSRVYRVLEWYDDSGLTSARATVAPSELVDFIYNSISSSVYNPITQTTNDTNVVYHVTGRILPVSSNEDLHQNLLNKNMRVMIRKSWIGFTPENNDTVSFGGITYTVDNISQNALMDEWYLSVST